MRRPKRNRLRAGLMLLYFIALANPPTVGAASSEKIRVCFAPPLTGGCDPLATVLQEIGSAHRTIRVQMYALTLQEIVGALVKARHRGVDVRVIVDRSQLTQDRSEVFRVAGLASSGVPVLIDTVPGLMHNKIMVIDSETVLTGSFNYTWSAERFNAENLLVVRDPSLAAEYTRNWNERAAKSQPLAVATGAEAPQVSGNTPVRRVVGNRRSMIYEWPGCPYYDKISPRNRVEFTDAKTAKAAGYRAAKNCP
jgi:phosphatidylserine/phosphatidylglycerophosphate/cardiolipin synthase-like enzyme